LEVEFDSQRAVIESVNATGYQIVCGLGETDKEAAASQGEDSASISNSAALQAKLDEMNLRWSLVQNKYTTVRYVVYIIYSRAKPIVSFLPISDSDYLDPSFGDTDFCPINRILMIIIV